MSKESRSPNMTSSARTCGLSGHIQTLSSSGVVRADPTFAPPARETGNKGRFLVL